MFLLVAAGKTWKSYAEDLPSVGYLGLGETGNYASRHNPVVYFTDVRSDSTQARNVVPFTQLATDLGAHALPQYGRVFPPVDRLAQLWCPHAPIAIAPTHGNHRASHDNSGLV